MKGKIFRKGITRRLLSVILSSAMVLSLMPINSLTVNAYGDENKAFEFGCTNWEHQKHFFVMINSDTKVDILEVDNTSLHGEGTYGNKDDETFMSFVNDRYGDIYSLEEGRWYCYGHGEGSRGGCEDAGNFTDFYEYTWDDRDAWYHGQEASCEAAQLAAMPDKPDGEANSPRMMLARFPDAYYCGWENNQLRCGHGAILCTRTELGWKKVEEGGKRFWYDPTHIKVHDEADSQRYVCNEHERVAYWDGNNWNEWRPCDHITTTNPNSVVTITSADIPRNAEESRSFTKKGVTVTADSIDANNGNLLGHGTFTTSEGKFTRIELNMAKGDMGSDWVVNGNDTVWTGNASSVSFENGISMEGWSITFTLDDGSGSGNQLGDSNIYWQFDSDSGTLTISGNGDMPDFNPEMPDTLPFYDISNEIENVVVGDGVTRIGSGVFAHCRNLTSVSLPDGLTSIGDCAFQFCGRLTSISLPSSLENIGNDAFYKVVDLTSIEIPANVTSIGNSAFSECQLTSVTLPEGLTSIGDGAFSYNDFTSVTIPASVTSIGDYAFSYCTDLTEVTVLAENPSAFGTNVFYKSDKLEKIIVPTASVDTYKAADGWSVYEAKIVGDGTSDGTKIGESDTYWKFENGTLTISGTGAMPDFDPENNPDALPFSDIQNQIVNVVVESGITSIGNGVFAQCDEMTSISLPDGLTSIGNLAFLNCNKLTSVSLPNSLENIGNRAFEGAALTSVEIPEKVTSIGNGAFSGCGLTSVTLPEGLETIGAGAFSSNNFTSVEIPASVTSIGDGAFEACFSLTEVKVLAENPPTLGTDVFLDSENLEKIIVPAASVDAYKAANGWSAYADKIVGDGSKLQLATPELSAPTVTANSIVVKWGKVTDAAYYRVYKKDAAGSWKKVKDVKTTSFEDTGVESGMTYTYTVRCLSADRTVYTSEFDKTGVSATYCSVPELKSATPAEDGVKVAWNTVPGAAVYRVYRKEEGGSWTKLKDTLLSSVVDKTAVSGTTYTYTVKCMAADRTTSTSVYDKNGISVTYCSMPVVTSISATNSGIKVVWDEVTGAGKYRVYRKVDDGAWTRIATVATTTYTDRKVTPGTKYAYTLMCANEEDTVSLSTYDKTGKGLLLRENPVLTGIATRDGGVRVTWDAVEGVSGYRIYRKVEGGIWTSVGATRGLSYTDKTVESGTEYIYTVRGLDVDNVAYVSGYDTTGLTIKYYASPKITALTSETNGVNVTWESIDGVSKYRVYRKVEGGSWVKVTDTTSTSCVDTKAVKGTQYIYTVRCLSEDGRTYLSAYDTVGQTINY